MLGDYMIATIYNDFAMSDINLALFEDTGFYKVGYYSRGLFKFGKNKGCFFSIHHILQMVKHYLKKNFVLKKINLSVHH